MATAIHPSRARLALCGVAVAGFVLLGGCSEEGVTPSCPELLLYDISELASDGGIDPDIQSNREQAAAEDCVTLAGDATSTGGAGGGTGEADADSD